MTFRITDRILTLSHLGDLIPSQPGGGGDGRNPPSPASVDPNYTKFGAVIVPFKKKLK